MAGLKIYACSGFGGVGNSGSDYKYWLDNTVTVNNTRAVNGLLAKINLLFSDLQYKELSQGEIRTSLNLLDLFVVCLQGAERYSGDAVMLRRWGGVVGGMKDEGLFDYDSEDNGERDIHLDGLIDEAMRRMSGQGVYVLSGDFGVWYKSNILDEDWNGIARGEKDVFAGVHGIGGSGSDAGVRLSQSGYYFFGMYLTDAQVKRGGKSIDTKVRYEKSLYEDAVQAYSSLYTETDFARVVYAGCQGQLKSSPEAVADRVFGSSRGVGVMGIDDIIALITAILPLILSAIQYITDAVIEYFIIKERSTITEADKSKGLIDPSALENAYKEAQSSKTIKASGSSLLFVGLVTGLLYKLIKNKKR